MPCGLVSSVCTCVPGISLVPTECHSGTVATGGPARVMLVASAMLQTVACGLWLRLQWPGLSVPPGFKLHLCPLR